VRANLALVPYLFSASTPASNTNGQNQSVGHPYEYADASSTAKGQCLPAGLGLVISAQDRINILGCGVRRVGASPCFLPPCRPPISATLATSMWRVAHSSRRTITFTTQARHETIGHLTVCEPTLSKHRPNVVTLKQTCAKILLRKRYTTPTSAAMHQRFIRRRGKPFRRRSLVGSATAMMTLSRRRSYGYLDRQEQERLPLQALSLSSATSKGCLPVASSFPRSQGLRRGARSGAW
jgi:hypothetical protein